MMYKSQFEIIFVEQRHYVTLNKWNVIKSDVNEVKISLFLLRSNLI